MLGAITGDIVGSIYEWNNIKTKEFDLFSPDCFFTDDTILTIALAESILLDLDYGQVMRKYYQQYPDGGYGGSFHNWANSPDAEPYNSWGNGSAMRTSAVGYAYDSLEEVLDKAEYFASFTHNHPEGIKGAQATASSIFLLRKGLLSKDDLKPYIHETFQYDLSKSLDEIRPDYDFDVSCQGTVPQAITAFLESNSFEDAIRNAISLGGDSDTLACIAGAIAEAHYGKPPVNISDTSNNFLDDNLRDIVEQFYAKYMHHK